MTAILDPALATPVVDAATTRLAQLEHLPTEPALELVHTVAGHAAAAVLRDLALASRETVQRLDGCHRVVRATTLLEVADRLDADATDLEQQVAARPATPDARQVELDQLRTENALLRNQLGAVVDELVARRLLCSGIGEHPYTPEQAARIADECRAYWAGVALRGGA